MPSLPALARALSVTAGSQSSCLSFFLPAREVRLTPNLDFLLDSVIETTLTKGSFHLKTKPKADVNDKVGSFSEVFSDLVSERQS